MAIVVGARRIKEMYEAADFKHPGVREAYLLDALEHLTMAQRNIWLARFCGITRQLSGSHWVDIPGARLSAAETADYARCDERNVWFLTARATARLLKVMGGDA